MSLEQSKFLFFIRIHHIVIFDFATGNLKHQSRSVSVVLMKGQVQLPEPPRGSEQVESHAAPGKNQELEALATGSRSPETTTSGLGLHFSEPQVPSLYENQNVVPFWLWGGSYESHPISVSHHHCNW